MARYIRYKRLKQQINFLNCNDLDKWEDTCNYRLTNFFDVCDSNCNCGDYGEKEPIFQYRWNNINPNYGYYCEDNNRYYKQRKEVSYDDGNTWYYTIPEEYQKGELYEANSRFCTSDKVMFEYKPDTESGTYCERYNKMQKYVKYVSFDNGSTWEVLTWNKPDGSVYKEYKSELIEENSCDCGYKENRFLFKDEYICGQDLGEGYKDKYAYEVWREYEICSDIPTGRVEYRNPKQSCDCGASGVEFVFSDTYVCGSDIEISGLTITEVSNGNIMNANSIQTSGITFGENLDVKITFTIQEKSNVKFNFLFSEGSNVFMMENVDTYNDFTNPLVNMTTGSYNCEFTDLTVGEHYLWLRLNNQSNSGNTITLSADVKAYSTEYDRKKKYEVWYEKDICAETSTGRVEYRNGKYDCDCGYSGNDYVFEGDYMCGSELGESYIPTSKYEMWVEKNLCTNEPTGRVEYRNPKPSIDCGASGNYLILATYGEFNTALNNRFDIYDNSFNAVETVYDIEDKTQSSNYYAYNMYREFRNFEITVNSSATSYRSLFQDTMLYSFNSNIDTSNITDFGWMFYNCNRLKYIDLSNFDTSNVDFMYGMFMNCASLTDLDLSNFDTRKVTDMGRMFYMDYNRVNEMTYLNLSSFDTRNVTTMEAMFHNLNKLVSLDVSKFDTSKVVNFYQMFYNCNSLMHIKCTQAFKEWCWNHKAQLNLPEAMQEGGDGLWEIV